MLKLTEADSCQRYGKWIDQAQGGIMALVISFVPEWKGLTKGFMIISFLSYHHGGTQANGSCVRKRPAGVGSDRMIEVVLLFLYRLIILVCFVSLKMRSKSSFRLYLPYSLALV